ncbi:MAG: hypothetical protein KF819_16595 [Labilithrix sp.]|nr:hypothetical protein [Labilithrix sp.]
MSYFDEVLDALVAGEAQAASSQVRELAEEVEGLKRQVAVLQRTVAALAAILEEEAGGSSRVRARLQKAMRVDRVVAADIDEANAEEADERAPAVAQSAYRGAVPFGGSGCAVCGRALERDDPELTLAQRGSVCLRCFQRGT